jgi:hypothetical protein
LDALGFIRNRSRLAHRSALRLAPWNRYTKFQIFDRAAASDFAKAIQNLPGEQVKLFLPDSVFYLDNQCRADQFQANSMRSDRFAHGFGPNGARKVVFGENPLRKLVVFDKPRSAFHSA